MKPLRYAWIVGLLFPASVFAADASLLTNDHLKSALHDVLSHGDLFDFKYVFERLGLGVAVAHSQGVNSRAHQVAVAGTTVPPVISGSPVYLLYLGNTNGISRAVVQLAPRQCPSLPLWAGEWGLKTSTSYSAEGGGTVESVTWPGPEGVALSVELTDGVCTVLLTQSTKRVITVP